MIKYILMLFLLLVSTLSARAQDRIDTLGVEIEREIAFKISDWKYHTDMSLEAFRPDFDDSGWKKLALDERIYPDSAWLRASLVIPQQILGKPLRQGGQMKILFSVDDGGICWINGEKKSAFDWTGEFILTESVQAGQKFQITIKAINTGGPLRILDAHLVWPGALGEVRLLENFIMSLRVGRKLLSDDTYLQVGATRRDDGIDRSAVPRERRLQLRAELARAAGRVDLAALKKKNYSQFLNSVQQARTDLKPVADFAQEFTLIMDANAHIDCAWLWRYPETIEIAKNTFSSVLNMMSARPDFTYTQSQAHLFWWLEQRDPELFRAIQQRVQDGRWELVGGMWVEPDCNLISGESWARQLLYGKRYFQEKFGVDVRIGWNPDSFGYNWNMPQFYRDAGIDAFITQKIGWNDTNMFPYRLFWWQGPDSSRLLTYFPYNYVSDVKNTFGFVDWLRQFEANTGFKKMLVLYGVGDHGGGPTPEMLDRIEAMKQLDVFPRLEYGTAAGYLDWLRRHDLSALPVWDDELYLEYHRGTYTTQSNTKKNNRQSEVRFATAEQVAALASLYGRPYPSQDFVDGWRGVLFNQFHDILPGSSIYPVYKDSDELYQESLAIAVHQQETALTHLAAQINTAGTKNALPVLIYNPLAWSRTDVVSVAVPVDNSQAYAVFNEAGLEIPAQRVAVNRYKSQLIFVACDIPAMGYAVYELRPSGKQSYASELKLTRQSLENAFYRIAVDSTTGWLASIFDRRLGRELLTGPGNELQLLKDQPAAWDAWNLGLGERYPSHFRGVELIESGPVRAILRCQHDFLKPGVRKSYPTPNNPNSYFVQDIVLYHGLDRIDFVTQADWWEEHVMLKVAFHLSAVDSMATFEIPFGTIRRPTTRRNNWEKARFEVSQQKWLDLSDQTGAFGVSLLNRAKYGSDVNGQVVRLSLLRSPKWPDPMADMGKHVLEYALYPHARTWQEGNTMRKAYEYNYPLIAKPIDSHKGPLPKRLSFFAVEQPNVILHAVKLAEPVQTFSKATAPQPEQVWILRLFEAFGTETEASITLPASARRAVLSNILEADGTEIPVSGNQLKLVLPAHRIATVKVWF